MPAAVLVAAGVSLVVVGSAALMEHGDLCCAADLDVVPDPHDANLIRLREELERLAVPGTRVGPLESLEVATVLTSFGSIDVLVERGRLEFAALRGNAELADVHGVGVAVASRDDAWRLRRRYKAAS